MKAYFSLLLFVAFVGSCTSKRLEATVKLTSGSENVKGTIYFIKIDRGLTQVRGTISGLKEGVHGVHIHENKDISDNCANVGDHFDPDNEPHGVHVGDVANINANDKGIAELNVTSTKIRFNGRASIIGHALGIDAEPDLYGEEKHNTIACGIIKRFKPHGEPKHHHPDHHGDDHDH